jgi:polyisoprenoid-binding protein YceI
MTDSVHWSLKDMKTVKLLVLAAALAISPACKKDKAKEEPKKDPVGTTTGSGSAVAPTPDPAGSGAGMAAGSGAGMAGSGAGMAAGSGETMAAGSGAAATPTEAPTDWIEVEANHFTKKDGDPVKVKFEKFKVVKADFDPKKIEGGTATIEIDLSSLKSGDDKRDEHLKTPDYIDLNKFTTATVDISNVKKKDEKNFTADAKVKFHGAEKKYPVKFEVVDAKDDWIRVKAEQSFKRTDFKVGKKAGPDPKKGDDGVAEDLTIKLQLTLKKT